MVFIGCAGIFIPVVPGPLVAFCGPLAYFIFTRAEEPLPYINTPMLCIFGVFVALSFVFDYASSWWGAAKFGATWRGGVGALAGAIVFPILLAPLGLGIFGAFAGLLVGPLIGAFLGEYLGGNTCEKSARAGIGTLVGAIAATLVKLFVCMLTLVWLVAAVIAKQF